MKTRTKFIIAITAAAIAAVIFFLSGAINPGNEKQVMTEIKPVSGDISLTVSTTGTVLPKNRLELMPSVAGRIEKILVNEGDEVKTGQVLALMSSTDRAALIDAARLQGSQSLKYWENAYKPIPIVSPINGTVIVRSVEPGQTVTTSTAIITISDRLIVKAQVDETDIGRVKEGQSAFITLDSHPEILVKGRVTHIYYESSTVNNVTVYYVLITPDRIPAEFRSGMSATVEIIEREKKGVILLPEEAVFSENGEKYVMVKNNETHGIENRAITTGLTSDSKVEITSGITLNDTLVVKSEKFVLQQSESEKNLFMPARPNRSSKK